ncbi:sporulation histidine kinase inhibitor Sda [Gracilibacillus salitolerans]|uniref:Sporulation histidine kinase inhibitor Sda n=1 Tax=Gracilibacillus salitolerans TaxID=2663022 RepID=A0A5Q2TPQ5_9BACI|nr:sporulation histidine kinase inhibitor Sda [Gracilibacillus salitolerans]QGH36102.1 sporulation histidine kinase inhibitor Sda [Gracilibacillus salitolerans]
MSMNLLTNEKLVELYCAAKKQKVNEEFIKLVELEMTNRQIRIDLLEV